MYEFLYLYKSLPTDDPPSTSQQTAKRLASRSDFNYIPIRTGTLGKSPRGKASPRVETRNEKKHTPSACRADLRRNKLKVCIGLSNENPPMLVHVRLKQHVPLRGGTPRIPIIQHRETKSRRCLFFIRLMRLRRNSGGSVCPEFAAGACHFRRASGKFMTRAFTIRRSFRNYLVGN